MTPSQMIRKKTVEAVPKTTTYEPLIVPGTIANLYAAENKALQNRKCPHCGGDLDVDIRPDGLIYYQCTKNRVFHEWRRPQSFITRD